MIKVLHYFNYDLCNDVISSKKAPGGYYYTQYIHSRDETHMYCIGGVIRGFNSNKNTSYFDEFDITDEINVFQY